MEPIPIRQLRTCAETDQTCGQAFRRIPKSALSYRFANSIRQTLLRSEQRKIGPKLHEVLNSTAHDAVCQVCVRFAPSDLISFQHQTRRGAFQNQTSHPFRSFDCCPKGYPPSHGITNPRRVLSLEIVKNRDQVLYYLMQRVSPRIGWRIARAVTQKIDRDHPMRPGETRQNKLAPPLNASGKTVDKKDWISISGSPHMYPDSIPKGDI